MDDVQAGWRYPAGAHTIAEKSLAFAGKGQESYKKFVKAPASRSQTCCSHTPFGRFVGLTGSTNLFLPRIFLGTASGQFLRPAASRLLLSRLRPYTIGFPPMFILPVFGSFICGMFGQLPWATSKLELRSRTKPKDAA